MSNVLSFFGCLSALRHWSRIMITARSAQAQWAWQRLPRSIRGSPFVAACGSALAPCCKPAALRRRRPTALARHSHTSKLVPDRIHSRFCSPARPLARPSFGVRRTLAPSSRTPLPNLCRSPVSMRGSRFSVAHLLAPRALLNVLLAAQLLTLPRLASAAVQFVSPIAGAALVAGGTLEIAWVDDGLPPTIADLTTYKLFLCAGGNTGGSFVSALTCILFSRYAGEPAGRDKFTVKSDAVQTWLTCVHRILGASSNHHNDWPVREWKQGTRSSFKHCWWGS